MQKKLLSLCEMYRKAYPITERELRQIFQKYTFEWRQFVITFL